MRMSALQKHLAVFPGMFDPPTLGHVNIAHRACLLFDRLIVAVGVNPEKREWFPQDERVAMVRESLTDCPNVTVEQYDGLTVDYVREAGANDSTIEIPDCRLCSRLDHLIEGLGRVF